MKKRMKKKGRKNVINKSEDDSKVNEIKHKITNSDRLLAGSGNYRCYFSNALLEKGA